MHLQDVEKLIQNGESETVEFKGPRVSAQLPLKPFAVC
jgi:predicted HTH transcriptional regulator